MSSNADCFIVQPACAANGSLIVGRNAEDAEALGVAQEVHYYDVSDVLEGKTDGGASAEEASGEDVLLRVILQKPKPGVWGGDFGANERGVVVGLTWTTPETASDESLLGTDIVRLALARATSAEQAVDQIGQLVVSHNKETAKLNFIVCDAAAAWLISCSGKAWAAKKETASYLRIAKDGLTVIDDMDKFSEGVHAAEWQAANEDNGAVKHELNWCGVEPSEGSSYSQQDMFSTLRDASNAASSRAANVSVLTAGGISCHWFTATPNASESVFKPFVFAPNPRISPLTKLQPEADGTLLHKLHAQRKPAALEHLRSLEASCVEELNNYFSLQNHASDELDELLKDCVEAEVKFYR